MAPPTREPEFTGAPLSPFLPTTSVGVIKLLGKTPSKSCTLDPLPTWMLKQYAAQMAPLLTQIVNLSLVEGRVLAQMKRAIVRPLQKKTGLDHDDFRNYRPVSNLSFLSKLLERVVTARLCDHLAGNDIGEQFQSAYKPLHSTETALICVYNDIMRAMDDGRVGVLVMLDLPAAFDPVNHGLLLDRLHVVGVRAKALSWFRSYLNDRHQCVVVGGERSSSVVLSCGVPQGSVLGPLLFSLYTVPPGAIVKRHGLDFHFYADDCQLYLFIQPVQALVDGAVIVIERCAHEGCSRNYPRGVGGAQALFCPVGGGLLTTSYLVRGAIFMGPAVTRTALNPVFSGSIGVFCATNEA